MYEMKKGIVVLAWLAASGIVCADGVVCVDSITIAASEQSEAFSPSDTFTVAIDDSTAQTITTNSAGGFTHLDVTADHLVVIKRNGKPEASFRFDFESKGSDHLRLWFETQYQTWQLSKPGRTHECAHLKRKKVSNKEDAGKL
jgi:hypothetical protein